MGLEATFLSWAALALVAVISPGPDVLLVVGHATRGGQRNGLLAVAGIAVGSLWYMTLCGFGFLSVLTSSPTLFAIVKIGGAIYLAFLGLKLLRGAILPQPAAETQSVTLSLPFRIRRNKKTMKPNGNIFFSLRK